MIARDPSSDMNLRAYQVLHVTGGRSIIDIENHSESELFENSDSRRYDHQEGYAVMSSRERTIFVIDCFYMDFDGIAYGPRPQRFALSDFAGKRDVSSLPVSPPTRTEVERGLLGKLLDRGKKFVQCTEEGRYSYHGRVLEEWDPNHRDACVSCSQSKTQDQVSKAFPSPSKFG